MLEGPEDQALDRIRNWLTAPEGCTDRRGCLLAKATAELAWENDAIAARSLAAYETLLDSCRQLVEQAQRAGHLDPAADAAVLGGLILTTHRGLEALAKAGVDTETQEPHRQRHDRQHRAHSRARVAAPAAHFAPLAHQPPESTHLESCLGSGRVFRGERQADERAAAIGILADALAL